MRPDHDHLFLRASEHTLPPVPCFVTQYAPCGAVLNRNRQRRKVFAFFRRRGVRLAETGRTKRTAARNARQSSGEVHGKIGPEPRPSCSRCSWAWRRRRSVADGSHDLVDSEGHDCKQDVAAGAGCPTPTFREEWLMMRLPIHPRKKVGRKRARFLFSIGLTLLYCIVRSV